MESSGEFRTLDLSFYLNCRSYFWLFFLQSMRLNAKINLCVHNKLKFQIRQSSVHLVSLFVFPINTLFKHATLCFVWIPLVTWLADSQNMVQFGPECLNPPPTPLSYSARIWATPVTALLIFKEKKWSKTHLTFASA